MSILHVRETGTRRGATIDRDYSQDLVRTFDVVTDDPLELPETVLAAVDPETDEAVPQVGDIRLTPGGGEVRCVNVHARQEPDNYEVWRVEAEYSSSGPEPTPSPIDRPLRIRWGVIRYQVPATEGYLQTEAGEDPLGPLTTSARHAFDPPPLKDATRLTLSVNKVLATFPDDLAVDFQDAVNDGTFYGRPAGTVKCVGITGENFFEAGAQFYDISFEFEIRAEGWLLSPMDQDTRNVLNQLIVDNTGNSGTPWKLDGSGMPAAADADPVFRRYRVYPLKDFSELGIS